MHDPQPTPSHEAPRDPVEIRDDDAITIHQALTIATERAFLLGKSTLQRWAKYWHDHPTAKGAVRSILVDTREGAFYKLSREDFEVWVFDQQQNARSRENPEDPVRPSKTSQGPARSNEIQRGFAEPQEASSDSKLSAEGKYRTEELEKENFNLKVDLAARKQLLDMAREELTAIRSEHHNALREIGGLQFQIRQLHSGTPKREETPTDDHIRTAPTTDAQPSQPE